MAAFALLVLAHDSGPASAQRVFDGYDQYYDSFADRLFKRQIHQDRSRTYSIEGEGGEVSINRVVWKGRAVDLLLTSNYFGFAEHGYFPSKRYRLEDAFHFKGETFGNYFSYSSGAEIYVARRAGFNAFCVNGGRGSASGESGSRYEEIYLLVSTNARPPSETLLHLPSLLSSCRAVRLSASGEIMFPANEYRVDPHTGVRYGLKSTYYKYDGRGFVLAGESVDLLFVSEANPFVFSRP